MPQTQHAPPEEHAPVAAFDIGGTHLRAALAGPGGEVLARLRQPTDRERTADQVRAALRDLQRATSHAEVAAVVIGVPGVVGPDGISEVPNVPALEGAAFMRALNASVPAPLRFANDANLAALGEGGTARHLVFVAIGTGLGCGVLLDGRMYAGAAGRAGELGLFPYPSAVGAVLEDLLSGPGAARLHAALGGAPDAAPLSDPGPAGQSTRAALTDALQFLLNVIAVGFDPEEVVVGGGLGLHLGALIEDAAARVGLTGRVRLSRHGDDAALHGGLRLARELSGQAAPRGAR